MRSAGFGWLRERAARARRGLFAGTPRPGGLASARRLGWAWRCLTDEDAGLVS